MEYKQNITENSCKKFFFFEITFGFCQINSQLFTKFDLHFNPIIFAINFQQERLAGHWQLQ